MFTAASFVTSKTGDNPTVHSIMEREIVMLPSAIKKGEVLTHATT